MRLLFFFAFDFARGASEGCSVVARRESRQAVKCFSGLVVGPTFGRQPVGIVLAPRPVGLQSTTPRERAASTYGRPPSGSTTRRANATCAAAKRRRKLFPQIHPWSRRNPAQSS